MNLKIIKFLQIILIMIISLGVVSSDDNITQSFDDIQKELNVASSNTLLNYQEHTVEINKLKSPNQ